MKIQYLSDIHMECQNPLVLEKTGDVLVLAGDFFTASTATDFEAFIDQSLDLGYKAILFVLGNHEGYGWSVGEAKGFLRELEDKQDRFWFLDRNRVVIEGQRFLGASLWSAPSTPANIHARLYMNDYRAIFGWTINDHIKAHWLDLDYLKSVGEEGDVIITHFPPTYNGIDVVRFGGDVLNSWFVNDLNELMIDMKPQLWISGHTHHVWDEMVGHTRDVGNCRGYSHAHHGTGNMIGEVKDFDPTRAIKIETINSSSIGATP